MIGEKIGKYMILEALGTGNMGTVYKAEDPEGRIVALKLVRSQVLYDVERRERFLQGILAASLVHHDGICPILEIGDDNDDFFVVMPYLEGRTLEQCLEHKPVPWQRALAIAIAVGQALAAAHAGRAVHRGLKPSNIWLQKEGTVIVSDCSIARFTEMPKRSRTKSIGPRVDFADTLIPLAALAYMSPEQVRGDNVDARTDIFSLGAILYEMLTGRHPFDARNSLSRMSAILEAEPPPLTSRLGSIPQDLDRIVRRALAKEPSDRYGSMQDLLTQLEMVQRSVVEQPRPLQETRKVRRFRTLGWLTLITLILALIAVFLYRLCH
jgi:non-specific serine/threonine protein kinase